jgi:hypothetical protein
MAERWRKRHLGAPEVRAHDHAEYTASLAVKAALATQARAHIQEVLLTHYPAHVPIADLGALLKWPETYKKHLKGLRRRARLFATWPTPFARSQHISRHASFITHLS